jgi:hypothetical protein
VPWAFSSQILINRRAHNLLAVPAPDDANTTFGGILNERTPIFHAEKIGGVFEWYGKRIAHDYTPLVYPCSPSAARNRSCNA